MKKHIDYDLIDGYYTQRDNRNKSSSLDESSHIDSKHEIFDALNKMDMLNEDIHLI